MQRKEMHMFENFSEGARRTMSLARTHAQHTGRDTIGTESILVGIIELNGDAAKLLKRYGVTHAKVVTMADRLTPPNGGGTTLGQLPFKPRAKRAIELAAVGASSKEVTDTHLLLGLLSENECIAFEILTTLGITAKTLGLSCINEKLEQKVETDLDPLANELNRLSDELRLRFVDLDKSLASKHLGIEVWISIDVNHSLGYTKATLGTTVAWGVVVSPRSQPTPGGPKLVRSAPRETLLLAAPHVQKLLDAIGAAAKKQTKALKTALAEKWEIP